MYCSSAALLPLACVGTTQYATFVVSIVLPSSFFHVIVYSLGVSVYSAVYTCAHVTECTSGLHFVNAYTVDSLWLVAGNTGATGVSPYAKLLHVVIISHDAFLYFHVIS